MEEKVVVSSKKMQFIVYGHRANVQALSRQGPGHLAYHHYRRLLCAP